MTINLTIVSCIEGESWMVLDGRIENTLISDPWGQWSRASAVKERWFLDWDALGGLLAFRSWHRSKGSLDGRA